jgi:AT hook motif
MKTKHAKGPDGKPLVSINSGRGRGRPKKNQNEAGRMGNSNVVTEEFFRAYDKAGGPLDPLEGFADVYTEIFIKLAKKEVLRVKEEEEEDEDMEEEVDEEGEHEMEEEEEE